MQYDCPKHIRLTDGHAWIHSVTGVQDYAKKKKALVKKVVPVPTTQDKKEAVYLMRQAGASYEEIAEKLDISQSNAYGLYSKYCQSAGIVLRGTVPIKEQAYKMALSGLDVPEIAKKIGREDQLVRQYIGRYCLEKNLKNPLHKPKPKTKSQTAYELRCAGMTYKQVGATMDGQSDQAARSLVVAYCRQHGLDIPQVVR